ncbi:MAG: hypothetical protein A3I12_05925 [Gammaproteobacteria bacterium RIFCSPLOWO2_02_FULL_38_11]|nr:MAG: hypothetical protein A3B69_04005 [Gammaproteobacteria bacterium RIFCSPHIGHO2_02_FULL_38_33]OGT24880.1 MAG: hypothetical protein A2W47_07500 [Gammaproteobacteria bacterium RIFCSPHIGHO2_12_38_15]OGT69087.1 MAG: hypothetical protein A3I12_05925 [Gammaproteobacteria bacterium RIFCSPLOWO2_02_FULL_38_11]OGT76468.1 MAG: hypothetical protein A3G71_05605 [Gammaproteobacteria bacterium RIFCSPLOWO2_12_FULL_38_14]
MKNALFGFSSLREKHTAYFKKKGNLFCVFRSNLEPILDCFEKCVSPFTFFQNHLDAFFSQ